MCRRVAGGIGCFGWAAMSLRRCSLRRGHWPGLTKPQLHHTAAERRTLRQVPGHDNVCIMSRQDGLQRSRRPTLADVAKTAGVSTSTASRALSGHPRVSPATRDRVTLIADTVGFAPNEMARSLRTRASMLVGIVVPDVAIPFYSRVLKGAQSRLEKAGYEVLVMNTDREPDRERRALATLQSRQVDAMLIATSGGCEGLDVPVVLFDHVFDDPRCRAVTADNAGGMELLVDHLARVHCHERIAFLGAPVAPAPGSPPLEQGPAHERLEAFRACMGRRGLAVSPEAIVFADHQWSEVSAQRAAEQLLERAVRATAVVTAGDTLALGGLRGFGAAVPSEMALVSFDDPVSADLLRTPVTALRRHDRALGECAAEMVLRTLAGDAASDERVRLPLELVVRSSCGCHEGAP